MTRLPNNYPGEMLREEFLHELTISPERLAHDLALHLGRYFGNSPKFWLGLQNDYDLEEEHRAHQAGLESIQQFARAVWVA